MRARRSAWSTACLAAGLVLSLAAAGCGDDDDGDDTPVAGAGGKTAGTGGKSGAGGAGKGGTGGAAPIDMAKCVTDTTAILKDQPGALSSACISCICKEGATKVNACNIAKNGACWGFIGCYAAKGCTPMNQDQCVVDNCSDFLMDGLGAAQMAGPLIQMGACATTCNEDSPDAGANDAGN